MSPFKRSDRPAVPSAVPPGDLSSLAADARTRLDELACATLGSIRAALDDSRPGRLGRLAEELGRVGQRDFVLTATLSASILQRRVASAGMLADKGSLSRRLEELRKAAADLDPGKVKLGQAGSPEKELAELARYFERFARTQPRLESALAELTQARFSIERDSAAIQMERSSLSVEADELGESSYLLGRLDAGLETELAGLDAAQPDRARALRTDVLSVVRRRRLEIESQLAVATQGLAALSVLEDSNAQILDALSCASETTTTALRTAVLVARAAASQRLALEHMRAARLAAGAMADQAAALQEGLRATEARTATLREAWTEMRTALDEVEARKRRLLASTSGSLRIS